MNNANLFLGILNLGFVVIPSYQYKVFNLLVGAMLITLYAKGGQEK